MSGIDAPQPWAARYAKPATPPPNGTRYPCHICGCKPGEYHKRERPSIHAHSYAADPPPLPPPAADHIFVSFWGGIKTRQPDRRASDPEDVALD